jgi:hypothetical protein
MTSKIYYPECIASRPLFRAHAKPLSPPIYFPIRFKEEGEHKEKSTPKYTKLTKKKPRQTTENTEEEKRGPQRGL